MDTARKYRRLELASRVRERLFDELVEEIEEAGLKYMTALRAHERVGDRSWFSDEFPESVEEIEKVSDGYRIRGSYSRRGCTDSQYCTLPFEFFEGTPEAREKIIADLEAATEKKKEEVRRVQLDLERQKYEELRAKFENGDAS